MKVCPECGGTYPVAEGFCPMDGARLREPITQPRFDPRTLIGQVLDRRYRVDDVIGEGGMGFVYRVTHTLIGKGLAVKILRPEHLDDEEVGRRFLQEARLASAIKHPNVVDISDFGVHDAGSPYYVMELLTGRTLAKLIDETGPVPPTEAMAIALQVLAGLEAAHEQGIVHRDLKPDNVFLVERDHMPLVKLLDFGIARAGPRRITALGALLGTPEYMAPEQARGEEVDWRADLYAVGIILFEMLVGRAPFRHRELATVIEMHVHQPPPHLIELAPTLDLPRTDALLQRLLAKDPAQRPRDAHSTMALLQNSMEQDLGADTAERVKRTTRALGSGGPVRGGTAIPATGRWSAPRGWTADSRADPRALPSDPRSDPGAFVPAPAPAPVLHARRSSGAVPAIALGCGAAAFAAILTFGVVRLLQLRADEMSSGSQAEDAETADDADPATAPIAGLDGTPASVQVAPGVPSTPVATKALPASGTSAADATTPGALPIDPKRPDDRLRPAPAKKKKSQGAKPTNAPEPAGAKPQGPPVQKPSKPSKPAPPPPPGTTSGKVTPGDLKDPFSSN
jgi:serine/threonine-protein kinase